MRHVLRTHTTPWPAPVVPSTRVHPHATRSREALWVTLLLAMLGLLTLFVSVPAIR